MSHPKLLMLDEPSMGLAPILVEQIFGIIKEAARFRHYHPPGRAERSGRPGGRRPGFSAMETGRIVLSGTGAALMASDQVQKAYLGG